MEMEMVKQKGLEKNNVVILFVNQIREARKSRISKQPSGDENCVKIILLHQSGRIGRLFNTGALFQVNIYMYFT